MRAANASDRPNNRIGIVIDSIIMTNGMTKPKITAFVPTDAETITLTFSPREKRVVSLVYTSIIFSLLSDEVQ